MVKKSKEKEEKIEVLMGNWTKYFYLEYYKVGEGKRYEVQLESCDNCYMHFRISEKIFRTILKGRKWYKWIRQDMACNPPYMEYYINLNAISSIQLTKSLSRYGAMYYIDLGFGSGNEKLRLHFENSKEWLNEYKRIMTTLKTMGRLKNGFLE